MNSYCVRMSQTKRRRTHLGIALSLPLKEIGPVSLDVSVFVARADGKLISHGRKYRAIDLFSGAGGLSLGFSAAFGHCFTPVWANDIVLSEAQSYNANFGEHCHVGDIVDILNDGRWRVPPADVVIGGPPCQGFSLLNKNRKGDPRRQLWRPFLEAVQRSSAKVFVMENVPQLLGTAEHDAIVAEANRLGFSVTSAKLCAADYGVPQIRYRAFIIGARGIEPSTVFPPTVTHCDPNRNGDDLTDQGIRVLTRLPWRTVKDVIGDLPAPVGTEIRDEAPPLDLHFGRNPTEKSRARYRAIPKEGMNRFDLQRIAPHLTPECWIRKKAGGTDLFGRMWWDRPSFTIRTEFFKPEKGRYLHPQEHRPITHREAARLQTFPDSFVFKGAKIDIARQIGNAVPPVLAARVADSVVALLAQR